MHNGFVKKLNAIDTNKLVDKIDYDAKIKDVEDKIPSISNLATTDALVKKADYVEKIKETEDKYFTIFGYNKFPNNVLDVKIKNKNIVDKSDISKFINNSDLDKKIETLANQT